MFATNAPKGAVACSRNVSFLAQSGRCRNDRFSPKAAVRRMFSVPPFSCDLMGKFGGRAMGAVRSIGLALLLILCASRSGLAQNREERDFVLNKFTLHDGSRLAALSMHYITLGDPKSPAVLVLHGTGGSGASLLSPAFGGELFGPGQPLDAGKYFIILPDMIGSGRSSKPSDGLRMQFPRYNYDDMVSATYRLLTEGLKVRHLHLVMGNSMGGMLTWVWGETYPNFMDGLVPLASTPAPMSGRNWICGECSSKP